VGQLIYRHPVTAFLVMVYAISWSLYIPSFLSASGIGLLPFELSPLPFNVLATIFGVTLSAVIVTRVTQGREGVRALRRRYTHWQVGLHWYLLALVALPLLSLLGASLWLGPGPLVAFADRWELLFTVFLYEALVNVAVVNLWEEGGWTGFLLPRLQARWGPLVASVLVAVAHGLYHLPLLFIVGGVGEGTRVPPDRYWFYVVALVVLPIPLRALVTWLWNSTRGSVIIVALFHGAWNTTNGTRFIPEFVPPGPTEGLWVYGVYTVLALIVIALTRGRLAYGSDPTLQRVALSRPNEEALSRA
jgi:membrane protease YdiL (CAAX protease family)